MSIFHPQSDREPLHALPGELEAFTAQDLTSYPFFSLVKNKRLTPIDFRSGAVSIRVEAAPEHGLATIWDVDILIWAANRIVVAQDRGRRPSCVMEAMPDEILAFAGRGKGMRDVQRLRAALDRLQFTSITTSVRRPAKQRHHRFSWINEWKETTDRCGRSLGIELILPDWFFVSVRDFGLDLTIDREYFALWSGLERWLYRVLRKYRGHQDGDWNFDLAHLHARSGTLFPLKQFAYELGEIVRRQSLPGYHLRLSRDARGAERLLFAPLPNDLRTEALGSEHGDSALPTQSGPTTGGAP